MAKKKYKITIKNLEVCSSNIEDFQELLRIISKAASFERNLGHLKDHEQYKKMADDIIREIGEQI